VHRKIKIWWPIGAVVAALAVILYVGWLLSGSVTQRYEGTRSITIERGSSFTQVVDSLVARKILKNPGQFAFLAKVTGWHHQIKYGHYEVESGISTYDLLDRLRRGLQTPLRVTIPPGSRAGVVAAVLRRDLAVDSTEFVNALKNDSLATALGTDTAHLFGFMMPETYEFFWNTRPERIIARLKETYDHFFNDERRARAEELGLSVEDVLTIASIVEWEARLDVERAIIAGVYLNRLAINMPLQADPTVQYALMQEDGGRMRRLVYEDYKLEHPYNTYLSAGLPPGPITNPSPASVDAVLNPVDHDYLYFVADGSGGHTFSRSLAQHNRAAARYRQLMQTRRAEQQGD
jgi:UPF0755 protein